MKQANGAVSKDTEIGRSCKHEYITVNEREKFSQGLRWKLGINTTPCIQSRKGKRCVFCGFLDPRTPAAPAKVGGVFRKVLSDNGLRDVHRLELYVSGSFFDDDEVSFNSRLEIVRSIADSGVREVVVESRPEFITADKLRSLADFVDPKRITIAIGVETMDHRLRRRLSKGFSTRDLTRSMRLIARAGMNFQAYLLLNPPGINDEGNAIIDVISSAKKVISLAEKTNCAFTLALQPFFLARYSAVAEHPRQRRRARPPWLYTIALTVKLLDDLRGRNGPGFPIVLGNEVDNVDALLVASNYSGNGDVCPCTETTRKRLREINVSRRKLKESVRYVLESPCACRSIWETEVGSRLGGHDL